MKTSSINLWELITSAAIHDDRPGDMLVTKEHLTELGKSGCGGQELSLQATEDGWVIKVFSCYDGCDGDSSIKITIGETSDVMIEKGVNYCHCTL